MLGKARAGCPCSSRVGDGGYLELFLASLLTGWLCSTVVVPVLGYLRFRQ